MTKRQIIKKTAEYIKRGFSGETSGHDWWHILRAWQLAKKIGKAERADMFVVEMAVLLHDLGDYKLEPDRKDRQEEKICAWLGRMGVAEKDKAHIVYVVTHISFSKNVISTQELSLEGKVVQDADRLDAIGAIGITRAMVYTGFRNMPFYIPGAKPRTFRSAKDYQVRHTVGIQHFYEKLLLLKDKMNTKTAKKMAARRHRFMENYLSEFSRSGKGRGRHNDNRWMMLRF